VRSTEERERRRQRKAEGEDKAEREQTQGQGSAGSGVLRPSSLLRERQQGEGAEIWDELGDQSVALAFVGAVPCRACAEMEKGRAERSSDGRAASGVVRLCRGGQ
jgi:hypothetical protein